MRSQLGGGAAFIIGNGLLGVAPPLRMEAAGYPVGLIGIIMTAFSAASAPWRCSDHRRPSLA